MTTVHCSNPTCAATIELGVNLADFPNVPPAAAIVRKRTDWRVITEDERRVPICPRCFATVD